VGFTAPALLWVSLVLLGIGLVLLAAGAVLIAVAASRAGRERHAGPPVQAPGP
jgi:hypothetical protein